MKNAKLKVLRGLNHVILTIIIKGMSVCLSVCMYVCMHVLFPPDEYL